MPKTPKDQRDSAIEFQIRPGVDPIGGGRWRGVNTESDPGSLDPNEFQRADDVTLQEKNVVTRPGLIEKIDLSQGIANAIMGIWPAPSDNPRVRAWCSARGCFGGGIGTGSRILHLDETESPIAQVYADFISGADRDTPLILYAGSLYAGDHTVLRKVVQIWAPYGLSTSSFTSTPPSVGILPPFTGYRIRCGIEGGDGLLLLGLENESNPALSKIVSWNGLTKPVDELTGIRPPHAMGFWREKVVVTFDATAAHIRVRERATAQPGTWNTFALAGFQSAEQLNSVVAVRDKTFIAGGNAKIFMFDGAALTLVRTVATADTGGNGVTAVVLHEGLLHYIWNEAAPYTSHFGRQDPDSSATEWVDNCKNITADQPAFLNGGSACSYRSQIVIGGQQNWLVATGINNDVQGPIYALNGTSPSAAGFEIRQIVRFP